MVFHAILKSYDLYDTCQEEWWEEVGGGMGAQS